MKKLTLLALTLCFLNSFAGGEGNCEPREGVDDPRPHQSVEQMQIIMNSGVVMMELGQGDWVQSLKFIDRSEWWGDQPYEKGYTGFYKLTYSSTRKGKCEKLFAIKGGTGLQTKRTKCWYQEPETETSETLFASAKK